MIIPHEVPHHYIPQIQTQMEVTGCDATYFVQWQPAELAADGKEVFSIITVERDREWFARNVDALKSFWVDLMAARRDYVPPPPPPPPECLVNMSLYE